MSQRVRSDWEQALVGWRTNWPRMTAQLIVSYILGQGVFWRWGYDQLSIGGGPNRVMQVGLGQKVGNAIYQSLPHTRRVLLAIKAAEVLTDLGKCPLEGETYRRIGVTPDVVASAITQPAWSLIEACEKLGSMAYNYQAYSDPESPEFQEEFRVAISCIYGSVFRYGQALAILQLSQQVEYGLIRPLERFIRRTGPLVPVLAAVGISYQTRKVSRRYQTSRV